MPCGQHMLPEQEAMTQKLPKPSFWSSYVFGGALLLGIYLTSLHSYILFHSVAETFSILVSFSIFLFALNTLDFVHARYFFVLGTAYLFVGGFDFLHMMTYHGMGFLPLKDLILLPRPGLSPAIWKACRF